MQIRLFFICLSAYFLSIASLNAQACDCSNCPQFMQDLFVGGFNINVQGATNPTLGQNGQGVCGVNIHFDHTAICDISITLTSPSGQSITLVGPIGQFCTNMGNVGTDWDISFVPCGSGAVPDAGFSPQWNSNQSWGANNNYTGSYFPFAGCLQNFTGPVNGNWVLTVTDAQAQDTGNLYDYEIIFCDPSGINCVSCVADAGILSQIDVMSCEGDPNLSLNLPPTYNAPALEPPASDYTYAYVIAGSGGVIQSISASADLSASPAGNYTVCGISYLTAHQNLLPTPNGSLTVTQLTNQLNSNTPPFCGDITSNCVNVTIFPIPPDVEETVEVCSPECHDFLGQFYCQSGDYVVDQMNANGCHYNAFLHLTVNTPSFHTVNETICPGTCSTNPAFPGACGTGVYQTTLMNSVGCDSVLTLNLMAMSIMAVIQPPPMISCSQTTAALSGIGSTLGSGTSYLWSASNGGSISGPNNLITATAAAAGTYKLLVCRSIGGVTCCDSTTVAVTSSSSLPLTPTIIGTSSICENASQVYSVTPVVGATSYTWTVPAGVTIVSGQGTDSLTVLWNSALGGDICVTANNSCGSSPQACLAVMVTNTPPMPVLSGNLVVCRDSIQTYSADTIPGVNTFNWQITGGTILSGNGGNIVQVVWDSLQATGTICATAVNICGPGTPACLPITINSVPALPVISGDSTLCAGTTGAYSIQALNGATGYLWTVPAGATLVSGQGSTSIIVDWTATPGGNVCVQGLNTCGAGAQQCFPVTVLAQPVANAGIDLSFCGNAINLAAMYSIMGSNGAWTTVSGSGTAIFTDSTLATTNVSVMPNGTYQFQWKETNGICSDADTVQVAFNAAPMGGMVQANCDGTNQNYTISFPITGGTAPYNVPGGTVSNGIFTSDPIPNGMPYSFSITDSNSCVSPLVSGSFNCNCATNAGQMTLQLLTACPGGSVTALPAQGPNLDADDIGAFILHTNAGASLGTLLDENTNGTFTFLPGMVYGTTYYISFVVGNNMGGLPDLMDPCLSVAPGQPVTFFDNPMANAGADVSGCGLTLVVNGNIGIGASTWSVTNTPPGGNAAISNPQNSSTNVTATAFGAYTLTYTITNNGCVGTDDVLLNFGNSPIAGPETYICDGANLQYTVNFTISGGQAPYTVSGQAVNGSSFTSAPIPSGSSYNFTVTDANGCFSGTISGSFSCNCSTNAGMVNQTPIIACQSDSVTVQFLGGQTLDADDVTGYYLHTGSGASLGTIYAQNHTGKFGYWATLSFGTTYYISVAAGNSLNGFPNPNDPCFSVSPGQPVVFMQNPQPNAGADFVVCGLTANMPAAQSPFSGTWAQVSGPGTAVLNNLQDPKSMVTAPIAGTYVFKWALTNGMCSASDDVQVRFLDNPVVGAVTPICNGTNTGYTLTFSVTSGSGTYLATGISGSFTGNSFTSALLPNNSTYTFLVKDAFGCQSAVITGSYLCPCTTNAGTMDTVPLIFCADEPATATWNNDATLDTDDTVQFILHDPNTGTVFATNSQPVFPFAPGLQTGTTYYISAIAGNNVSNNIDPNDPCFNQSPGTPIQWKALPIAAIIGDATICNGSSTVLNINGLGDFPLQLSYLDGTGTPVQLSIPDPQTIPLSVSPTTTTTYSLVTVMDGSSPACSANLNSSVTVTVNQPVNAGMANAPEELCAGTINTIQLKSLITGEDPGGLWTETSMSPSTSGAFNASTGTFKTNAQSAGTYSFRYSIQAALPCPSQTTTVVVTIHPTPVADAGIDQAIDCHQDTAILGGPGTTIGNGIQYNWTLGGTIIDTTARLTSDHAGVYSLMVSNSFGCSSTDMVTLIVDNDIPNAAIINVTPVHCFGENNGIIVLDSITSAHPPVMFSLNGGPYTTNSIFQNLAPDSYMVTLLDNNGCEWNTAVLEVTEPAFLTVDLGSEILIAFGDSVLLQADASVPLAALSSLHWNPLLDTLNGQTYLQRFLPLNSKYVTLELVDTNGCRANARVLVNVDRPEQVYVPNIFKPGSDGFNDRLTVYGGHGVAEVESFRIFDRWGEQLFEAKNFQPNDPIIGWDGAYRGNVALPGVYVYFAVVRFIDGETKVYKGDVTIVR